MQGRIYGMVFWARAQGGKFQGRQIFSGGTLKKSRLNYGLREKNGCPRERNLREI
jgi:hypothetical protein